VNSDIGTVIGVSGQQNDPRAVIGLSLLPIDAVREVLRYAADEAPR
jgi:hypothetical protein